MRTYLLAIVTVWPVLGGIGCASVTARLPAADIAAVQSEQLAQQRTALNKYMAANARLQTLAAPIMQANAELCETTRMDIGVQTLPQEGFPKELRDIAKAVFEIGETPKIIHVRPELTAGNADAATAKVQFGDVLVQDGEPVSVFDKRFDASAVSVERGGVNIDASFTPQSACNYPVTLKYSAAINAYATGKKIIVTTGMMDFASDEEIALVLGHELAHNTQGHVRKIVQNTILGLGRGTFARQFESEADYVGLYYMARAGYSPDNAAQFWRRIATVSVKSIARPKTHPITPERFIRLEAAIAEVKVKQAAGEVLEPNFK